MVVTLTGGCIVITLTLDTGPGTTEDNSITTVDMWMQNMINVACTVQICRDVLLTIKHHLHMVRQ